MQMAYIPQKKSCNMQLNVGHINRIIGKDYAYVTSIISWSLKNIILIKENGECITLRRKSIN